MILMMDWLRNNLGSMIVLLLLIVIVAVIIMRMVRNKKQGVTGCGCKCSHCPMGEACQENERQNL